jgi:hypothetical protein
MRPSLAVLLAVLVAACSFSPVVPSGTISCTSNADCPDRLTCQAPSGDSTGRRLCCGPLGCVAAAAALPDAARADDAPFTPPPAPSDAGVAPGDVAISLPTDVAPSPPPDVAPPDRPLDVTPLVSCLRPTTPLPTQNGRHSYCSLQLLDPLVVLAIDTVDGGNPGSVASVQQCQARLDLGAKTTDPMSRAPRPLPAADLDVLVAVLRHFQGLCTQMRGDEVVGAYAAGAWARAVPNGTQIASAIKTGTGLDLEVLSPEQEVQQRYLAVTRDRRQRLVLHLRDGVVRGAWWPGNAQAPTEVVFTDLADADNRFFSNTNVESYPEARSLYNTAVNQLLDDRLSEWRQLMNSGRLDRSLTIDPEDAALALALKGDLRNGNQWDDAATFQRKVGQAQLSVEQPYGPGWGLATLRDLGRLVGSIDTAEFEQLRRDPLKSAYGVRLMIHAAFLENVIRADELPFSEAGMVVTTPSFGYLFRKRFPAQ